VTRAMVDPMVRIWAKVVKAGPDECWLWTGGVGQKGGPHASVGRKGFNPRRAIYEEANGVTLPRTRQVSTTCKVPRCLNPAHLYLRPWMDDVTRFWSHVRKAEGDACWEWQGTFFQRGYGSFSMLVEGVKKDRQAHRVAWEIATGTRLDGPSHGVEAQVIMHRCDNPKCVRPSHLELGTNRLNSHDAIAKGRNSRGEKHAEAMRQAKLRRGAA
jgi:hypothetical protein